MKIAFSTLGCPDWSFRDIISTAKDMGYDGIEIRGIQNELFAPDMNEFQDKRINVTKDAIQRLNLSIPCFSTACYLYESNNIEKTLRDGRQYIDIANKMNVPFIRVLGDRSPQPSEFIDDEFVAENLSILSEYGATKNVMPLIETNGVYANTARLVKLVKQVRGNVGILWDIHHPYRYFAENPVDTYEAIKHYLKYVHFKDSISDKGVIKYKMLGYGDLPIKEAVTSLKNGGYNGFISLEWVKRWYSDLEDPGVAFLQFVHYINKIEREAE